VAEAIMIADLLSRVEQRILPGMTAFYSKMEPDPLEEANLEFRDACEVGDFTSTRIAAQLYESRIERLAKVYGDFLTAANQKPLPSTYDKYFLEETITETRGAVLCDSCKASVADRKYIVLFQEYAKNELGDPERRIRSLCDRCRQSGNRGAS
jgi:hypothetical protein